eukprot:scaffold540066_cov15-Prasinocladus_malaysianus.AAC.1
MSVVSFTQQISYGRCMQATKRGMCLTAVISIPIESTNLTTSFPLFRVAPFPSRIVPSLLVEMCQEALVSGATGHHAVLLYLKS